MLLQSLRGGWGTPMQFLLLLSTTLLAIMLRLPLLAFASISLMGSVVLWAIFKLMVASFWLMTWVSERLSRP